MSILRVTRHHLLVGQPLACRSGAVVSLHRSTIAFREPRPTARTRSTGPRHRNVRLRAQAWPVYRCLSIVRPTQHHPLVGQPLVCRSGASRLAPSQHNHNHFLRAQCTHRTCPRGCPSKCAPARSSAAGVPIFEHREGHPASPAGGTASRVSIGCRRLAPFCSTIARCRERAAYKILFGRWRVTSCVGEHCYHRVVSGKLWDAQTPASRPRDGAQGLRCVLKLVDVSSNSRGVN